MAPQAPPYVFDRARVRERRDRAAARFEEYDFLKQAVSSQLVERLQDTAHRFEHVLDLGCHTGTLSQALLAHDGAMKVRAADVSAKMVAKARQAGIDAQVIDEEVLLEHVTPGSLDLMMSALSLHWVNDLPGTLAQIRKALRPDGLFLGALLGAGSLTELRGALSEAEIELTGGAGPRISPLPGLQDMAGLMQRAGFALPVVDIDRIKVSYANPFKLLDDLGGMAERAAFAAGRTRYLSRAVLMRMAELYINQHADERGRIPAGFNIVYVSGWAPAPDQPKPKPRGSATVSLADAIAQMKLDKED